MKSLSSTLAFLFAVSFLLNVGTSNLIAQDVQEEESMPKGIVAIDDGKESKPAVGDPAPGISGEDFNGNMLNLGDHRGKVVMLFFWGDWCPPSRAMYPHVRTLVESMPEESFKIIGVNSNDRPQKIQSLCDSGIMTWQGISWENGDQNIADDYGVSGWPSVYLVDAEGIIRHINPQRNKKGKAALNDALKQMMVESGAGEEDLSIIFDKLETSNSENGK